jgi:hypothetical protein
MRPSIGHREGTKGLDSVMKSFRLMNLGLAPAFLVLFGTMACSSAPDVAPGDPTDTSASPDQVIKKVEGEGEAEGIGRRPAFQPAQGDDGGSDAQGQLCEPGSRSCDGDQPQECNAQGTAWQIMGEVCPTRCASGFCLNNCRPGETRCTNNAAMATCNEKGEWAEAVSCGDTAECKNDICVAINPYGDPSGPQRP